MPGRLVGRAPERLRRLAAAVVRGDALAPLADRVRRKRAHAVPGTVPFGSTVHPAAAAVVRDFDGHAHAASTFEAVTAALEAAELDFVCSPDLGGRPRHLVVDQDDIDVVVAALRLALHAPGWCVQRVRRGALLGHPVVLDGEALGSGLRASGVRLFRALAAADGTVLGGAELGCDIQVWRRIEVAAPRDDDGSFAVGTRVAPEPNGWAPYLPPDTWAEANGHPTHVPAALRAPGVFDVTEPVDVVLTWVDASDPDWLRRRDAALEATAGLLPSAVDRARFESADELRYALRSVHYYASWVRRIHLVTAGQTPNWLDASHPRIRVVNHVEVFPTGAPPVFNSHAIESRLHHVPGLAEHYLYLNDDVMFGRMVRPEDFFVGDRLLRFGIANHLLDPSPATAVDPAIMAAAKNGRSLLIERFGRTVRAKVRHGAHPQLRSVVEQLEREHPAALEQVARSAFRSQTDISVAASLQLWYAAALGRAVAGDVDLLYLDIESAAAPRILQALLRTRQHQVMCLNATLSGPGREQAVARLQDMLERYYPLAAPWELPSAAADRDLSR